MVNRNLTFSLRLRRSFIKLTVFSFTSGSPHSNKSSALSRINKHGSDSLSKMKPISSAAVKLWFFDSAVRKWLSNFDVKSPFELSPRSEIEQTVRPTFWSWWPIAIAVDVFPNPGDPQTDTICVESEVKWSIISSHSFSRPVKWEGRFNREKRGLNPTKKVGFRQGKYKIKQRPLQDQSLCSQIFCGTRKVNRTNEEDSTALYSVAEGGDSMKKVYIHYF